MSADSTPGRWARVQELFLEALERPVAERSAFVEERCGDDPGLLREVTSLLRAHDEGPVPLSASARPGSRRYPERIGSYRIVRPLGEGGMGVVLLAVREAQGFTQTVALKLLPAFPHADLEARLKAERRILARLEHPGIARLIDGGVTESGQPFLAMEYVKGEDILTWCEGRRLDVDRRIALFLDVCDAVHYAHQQLVIHRDLKPSNILVTSAGRPKLLDFGVAKLLDEQSDEGHTRTGAWVTPAYASPEQLRRKPVTTLSDVYSLGVLLYELLVGARPYDTEGHTPAELDRQLAGRPPTRPSVLARGDERDAAGPASQRAAARTTTPRRLSRRLAGDLDVILLRALAHEPERRYTSAAALAEDLRRHLGGWPVQARPESWLYRTSKFVRRHRVAVAAAGIGALAILAGTGATVWQARRARAEALRAESEADRARQVTALVTDLFRLSDPARALGDTVTARQLLDEGTTRVESELRDQPELQATLMAEVARVYLNLGILPRAEELARRVVDLRATGEPGSRAHAAALAALAEVVAERGRMDEAVRLSRAALELPDLGGPGSGDTLRARVLSAMAWELRNQGRHDEAVSAFQEALPVQRAALGDRSPVVARTLMGLASALHDAGRFDDAEAFFDELIAEARDGGRPDPAAAAAMANLGMLRRVREELEEAEPLLRTALDHRMRLYGPDHPETLESMDDWGAELLQLGRFDEAREVLAEGLDRARAVLGEDHTQTISIREALAAVEIELGHYDAGLAMRDSALASKRRLRRGEDHPGIVYTLLRLASDAREAGRDSLAGVALDSALAMGWRLSDEPSVYRALALQQRAVLAVHRDERAAAERDIDAAVRMLASLLSDDHRYVLSARRDQALFRLRTGGAPTEALRALAVEDSLRRSRRPSPHPELGVIALALGEARLAADDAVGAADAFRSASAEFQRLPPTHWKRGAALVGQGMATRLAGDTARGAELVDRGMEIVDRHLGPHAPEALRLRRISARPAPRPARSGAPRSR